MRCESQEEHEHEGLQTIPVAENCVEKREWRLYYELKKEYASKNEY